MSDGVNGLSERSSNGLSSSESKAGGDGVRGAGLWSILVGKI